MRLTYGKCINIINYSHKGFKKEVYIFNSDSKEGAHTTPFNTIIMQDILFKDFSKNVRDYVFLHEVGHTQLNFLFRTILNILALPIIFSFFASLALFIYPILVFLRYSTFEAIGSFIGVLLIFFISSGLFMLLSWPIELHAELFAIKNIGITRYKKAINELNKSKKKSIFSRYFHRVRYPPEKFILWVESRCLR